MERDWDIVDAIDRKTVFSSVFCIFQVIDKNSGTVAYAVSDNGEAVGIFSKLTDAYDDMYQRMDSRRMALDSSDTYYEW